MNYSALIQNRKSVRAFSDKYVSFDDIDTIKGYYSKSVRRLLPEVKTELRLFGLDASAVLEGAAGYKQFLVGAPQYMVLLSEQHPHAGENAGYIMEDLILKLTDMGLDSCWLTFTDGEHVKAALEIDSPLSVAAVAAFGYGVKTTKRLRFNMKSMSDVSIQAQRRYFSPKKGFAQLVHLNSWGSYDGAEEYLGFYDDMLWEAMYAATLAPSYLNRQPYGFVLGDGRVTLVRTPDEFTGEIDAKLGLGVVLLHFSAVADQLGGRLNWSFDGNAELSLPEGHAVVASSAL